VTTDYQTMDGPWMAKGYVTDYLKADLPGRLVSYRNAWQRDESQLPMPAKIITYDAPVDMWPTVITVAMSASSMIREDYSVGGDPVYRVRYPMRTYIWARGEGDGTLMGQEVATRTRDELTTVIRSALLDHPRLRAADPHGLYDVLVDEGTMNEQYADLSLLKGDRYAAGAFIAYDMTLNEVVYRQPLGVAETFNVSVTIPPVSSRPPDSC
jgi:hypothetical protein